MQNNIVVVIEIDTPEQYSTFWINKFARQKYRYFDTLPTEAVNSTNKIRHQRQPYTKPTMTSK